jgi:hypothetical protein
MYKAQSKRVLSLLLTIMMIFSILPATALAQNNNVIINSDTTQTDPKEPKGDEDAPLQDPEPEFNLRQIITTFDIDFTLTLKSNLSAANATFQATGMASGEDSTYMRTWTGDAVVTQSIVLLSYNISDYTFKGWSINDSEPVKTADAALFAALGLVTGDSNTSGITDTTASSRPYAGGTFKIQNCTLGEATRDITLTAVFETRGGNFTPITHEITNVTIAKGATVKVPVTYDDEITQTMSVNATVSNGEIVSANGQKDNEGKPYLEIYGSSAGSTTVTPKIGSAITSSTSITVNVVDVKLEKNIYFLVDDTAEIEVKLSYPKSIETPPAIDWTSSNPLVLTVTPKGEVSVAQEDTVNSATYTATVACSSSGNETITADFSAYGISASCAVVITETDSTEFFELNGVYSRNGSDTSYSASPMFDDNESGTVYWASGMQKLKGLVPKGTKIEIDGASVQVADDGSFSHQFAQSADPLDGYGYAVHSVIVTAPDGGTSKEYCVVLQAQYINDGSAVPPLYLTNGGSGNALIKGQDYTQINHHNQGTIQIPTADGTVTLQPAYRRYVCAAAETVSSIMIGVDQKALVNTPVIKEARIRQLHSDGSLGDYLSCTVSDDQSGYLSQAYDISDGTNVFLMETQIVGFAGWRPTGVLIIYRDKNADKKSSNATIDMKDLTVTDTFDTEYAFTLTQEKSSDLLYDMYICTVTIPAGDDVHQQDSVKLKLGEIPSGTSAYFIESNGTKNELKLQTEYPIAIETSNSAVHRGTSSTTSIIIDSENGYSFRRYKLVINREPKAPPAELAGLLYRINNVAISDASGATINMRDNSANAFALYDFTSNTMVNMVSKYDFMAADAKNIFYMRFNPSTFVAADQAKIAYITLSPQAYCEALGASATIKKVTNEGGNEVEIALRSTYNIPHTGGYTDSNGVNCTKLVITVTPPELIAGAIPHDYTLLIPKMSPTEVTVSGIVISGTDYDNVDTTKGLQLYKHTDNSGAQTATTFNAGTYTYDVSAPYVYSNIYLVGTVSSSDTIASWKLNGESYTAQMIGNYSGVLPLVEGLNTVEVTYKLKTDMDGSTAKTYTFYVSRQANCNAEITYSENVDILQNSGSSRKDTKVLGFKPDQSVFDIRVTPDVPARAVTVMQNGYSTITQTGTVFATGLSLYKTVTVIVSDGESGVSRTYTLNPYAYLNEAPSRTYAAMPAPGQFVNTGWVGYDMNLLSGAIGQPTEDNAGGSGGISLGTFGGYVTYQFDNPIKNSANNKNGSDFTIGGNAFGGNSEPAAVMVAQDLNKDGKPDIDDDGNEIWYELAGSLYYEDGTTHNYSVTYQNPDPNFMPFIAQSGDGFLVNSYHSQPYYPSEIYYGFDGNQAYYNAESMTFTGTLLDQSYGRGAPLHFGYADSVDVLGGFIYAALNPYRGAGTCFDIDWAVDKTGAPVRLEEVSFLKIYNASYYDKDATGEVSPEIMGVLRLDKRNDTATDVGRTSKPTITLRANRYTDITLNADELPESGGILDINVGARAYVQTVVTNTELDDVDVIFVNNDRVASGAAKASFVSVTSVKERLVRVIVQHGEEQPYIIVLRLSGTAPAVDTSLKDLVVQRNGTRLEGLSRTDTFAYTMSVPSNYGIVQVVPTVKNGAEVTINGSELNDEGYVDVQLGAAGTDTKVTIVTTYGKITETTMLIITRRQDTGTGNKTGTATIAIEKFTLGQGYIVEPTQVTFNKGDTAADVTKALLTELYGSKGYISNNNSQYGFYLSNIYDPDRGELNIPEFISNALDGVKSDWPFNPVDPDPDYLGEFDYTGMSGWMITVDNLFIPVSSGSWEVEDGDVIRWQFTLYGLGADVGNSSPDSNYGGQASIIPATNRDELTVRLAEINARSDK